jgi:T5orf172 domain
MTSARKTLDDLLAEDDEFGLLNVKPLQSNAASDTSRIGQGFDEINQFVDRSGHAPGAGEAGQRASITERQLQMRLKAFRDDPAIVEQLEEADRHGLLENAARVEPVPNSLDDILALDDDILSGPAEDIFTLRHTRAASAKPDKVSERRLCADFRFFEPMFEKCAEDIASGKRVTRKFANEQEIRAGEFFILNGVMVFVAEVRDPHIRNGKRNARLRLIFDNGTEGQNLLRSLATELYKDPAGRRVSQPEAGPLFVKEETVAFVAQPQERVTGCIYVVKSLSPAPEISRFEGNLFKIGFTTGDFEDRLRGAKDDPTFLFAPVHPVRTYDAIDMNVSKFETLLHRFFDEARLDIEIPDRFGKPFKPREWFLLPLPVIEQAVKMLIDGSILQYRYSVSYSAIVPYDAE